MKFPRYRSLNTLNFAFMNSTIVKHFSFLFAIAGIFWIAPLNAQGIFGGGRGDGYDSRRITVVANSREKPGVSLERCRLLENKEAIVIELPSYKLNQNQELSFSFISLDGRIIHEPITYQKSGHIIQVFKNQIPKPSILYIALNQWKCYVKILD
jgi:hypothetical protein